MTKWGDQKQTKARENAQVTTNIYADKPGNKKKCLAQSTSVYSGNDITQKHVRY